MRLFPGYISEQHSSNNSWRRNDHCFILTMSSQEMHSSSQYSVHDIYVEKLSKCSLLLLTNYSLIEDTCTQLSFSAESQRPMHVDKFRIKAV
jgi:hypothetical protein